MKENSNKENNIKQFNILQSNNQHNHDNLGGEYESHFHIHTITENLKIAFYLNLSFTIIEIVSGIFTNSMAILSDSVHDLGDTLAIGGALYLEKLSRKGRDKMYSYGYKRYSPLGALINTLILIFGSILILVETIPKIFTQHEVKSEWMIVIAIVGLVFNGIAAWKVNKNSNNKNSSVIYLHLLEDVLGWVAVLIGSILIYYTNWTIIDPLLALGISIFILFRAYRNIKPLMGIFLQKIPDEISLDKVKKVLLNMNGIADVHDIHSWTLDGNYTVLTLHIVVEDNVNLVQALKIKNQAKNFLADFGINHYTIEIETNNENCGFEEC